MITVFSASNIIEAQLVAGLHISHRVTGQYLQGAIGELPAGDFSHILVPEDQQQAAREIIAAYEAGDYGLPETSN